MKRTRNSSLPGPYTSPRPLASSKTYLRSKLKTKLITALAVLCISGGAFGQPKIVASWNFDEGKGDVLHDVSGNGHDGKIFGARWTRGKFGGALYFDGKDDYVLVPADPAFDLLEATSIEVWARLESIGKTHDRVLVARSDNPVATGGWNLDWGNGTDLWYGQDGYYRCGGRAAG